MTAATLQDLIRQAQICSFSNRMPGKAERLANEAARLDDDELKQLRTAMIANGLHERMARRAGQAAPSSVVGANRIINSMTVIFGLSSTLEILREVEYDRRMASCVRRFVASSKDRIDKAQELYEHLLDLFGNSALVQELSEMVAPSFAS
jgi:hypothetical protein